MRTIRYQKKVTSMRCAHAQLSLTFTMLYKEKMSILLWFGNTNSDNSALESARQFVEAVDKEDIELKSRGCKRKSSERHVYDESTKTAIGKHALMHGKSAVKKFSITLK